MNPRQSVPAVQRVLAPKTRGMLAANAQAQFELVRKCQLMSLAALLLATCSLGAEAGWTMLFNGKDLSGWTQRTGDSRFYVQDGCIVGEVTSENDTNSVLITKNNYGSFVLELDFKADHCVFSGVHIRSAFASNEIVSEWRGVKRMIPGGHVYGYLVLIDPSTVKRWWTATLYDQRWWTAGIYDEDRRLWLYPGDLGGDPDEFSKHGRQIFKANDWNQLRIEAKGDSIKTYLNRVECAHINDSMSLDGFIGLQIRTWISDDTHETFIGSKVRFKNIRLQALPSMPAESNSH